MFGLGRSNPDDKALMSLSGSLAGAEEKIGQARQSLGDATLQQFGIGYSH
jgi:hypothetical protein